MNLHIRTITDEEVEAFSETMAVGFVHHLSEGEVELRRRHIQLDRTHAAFDGDHLVGTARSFASHLTVPGGTRVEAAGVTNVTVLPTHRRRGALTAMMAAQLDDIAARGEPLAVLIASESPIYGRYGYGAATLQAKLQVETRQAQFVREPEEPVTLVDPLEARGRAPDVYERFQAQQPGSIDRRELAWDFLFGLIPRPGNDNARERFHVVAGHDGYAAYRVEDNWDGRVPACTLHLDELVAATADAYAALWRYLIGLDWVVRIEAPDRPPVEPLPWLLRDARRARVVETADFLWVRLLDVPTALAARSYSGEGRLVLEVADPFRTEVGGRFALECGADGGAACTRTDESPDLTLGADDLAAAYLGGAPLYLPSSAGRVDEHTAGSVATFDRLFVGQPVPWCNTWF